MLDFVVMSKFFSYPVFSKEAIAHSLNIRLKTEQNPYIFLNRSTLQS